MSSRRKISVELPKRPSVFERLGTKPGMPQPKLKQSSRPKPNKPVKEKHTEKELPPADDRLLPKKNPVVKEPEKVPKDLKKKRVKRPRSRSSSSSSSSSGSSSSSSSSSDSSSSSEDEQRRKRSRKRRRSVDSRRRGGAARDKSRSPAPPPRKRRDKKRPPAGKKSASKKSTASPARSKPPLAPVKKRRSNSAKGKGPTAVGGARGSVRRSTSRGRKRSRSPLLQKSGTSQRRHSVSPRGRTSRSPRRGSPPPPQRKQRTPSPRRRASRSPAGRPGQPVGAARRDVSRRRSAERPRQNRSPPRQQLGGNYDRRAASTSRDRDRDRERGSGDRKDRRSIPTSSKQLDPPPSRPPPVDRGWEESARMKEEDVRRRRDDLRDRQWPARPPADYGREPLPYEEVPLLPPRRFSPGPVRADGRRPPLLAPPDDRLSRPPPYRHGPPLDERRSMDRMLPPRTDDWMPYDEGPPPPPPPLPPPPPPGVGRGMPRGGRDWSPPGRGPNFRRGGGDAWGGPPPRMNRGGFRRGGGVGGGGMGGGGGFHGGGGPPGPPPVGPVFYEPEPELDPPPDPGEMIVRDEVRSEEGGSGAEDERASPATDRRPAEAGVEGAVRASREREPPQLAEARLSIPPPPRPLQNPALATADADKAADGASVAAGPPGADATPSGGAVAESTPVAGVAPPTELDHESLSDFSDDADDILNREDEVVEEEITFEEDSGQDGQEGDGRAGSPASSAARRESSGGGGDQQTVSQAHTHVQTVATESAGEGGGDEAELEADGQAKPQSLVDALSIDWSSLVTPRPPRATSPAAGSGSVLERFSPAAVFASLGVCADWAGPQLVKTVADACAASAAAGGGGAPATDTYPVSEPVPSVEHLQRRYLRKAELMLADPGPYRRALCAKVDLTIRRHLCEATDTEPLSEAAAAATFKRDTFAKHLAMLTARVS